MRRSTTACVLLLALAGLTTTTALGSTRSDRHARAPHKAFAFYRHEIQKFRTETWYWQRLMGVDRARVQVRSLEAASLSRLQHLAGVWRRREHRAYHHAQHPPHLKDWLCIHRYEGSWHDHGAPYWGGLQMSLEFQRTYGPWLLRTKGTADNWTKLEQIWTAVKAMRSRGFHPWPHTARLCGLI